MSGENQNSLKQIFDAEYVNVQPHSGAQANMAVFMACLKPGDKFMGLNLAHGGHLSHGSPVNFSGLMFEACEYNVTPDTNLVDYDQMEAAINEKTKAVISNSPDRMVLGQDRKVSGLLDMYELMYEDFDRGTAEENLKKLNIEKDDYVGKLSKGNAEKVQILLTMSRKAKLFVLDEPFNGVDPVARESIIKLMLGCVPEDSSLLISTHQIGDIEQILDEAVFIKEGQLLFHRSVDEIRSGTGRSLTETYMEEFR